MRYCYSSLTILLCGCELFWQISCMAMILWNVVIKVWQFYCIAFNIFDIFTVRPWGSKKIWRFYYFFLLPKLTIFLCSHCFAYQLLDEFSGMAVSYNFCLTNFLCGCQLFLTNFLYGCRLWNKVDNFPIFCLKIGWQFYYLTKLP